MSSINVKPTLKLDTSQSMPPPSNADNPKPKLKLNTGSRQPSVSADGATPTPSREKIKINLKERLGSQPSTPAAASAAPTPITKSKAGRTSKPTKKLIESKKRGFDSDDEDRPLSETRQESNRPSKMIKIKHPVPSTPINSIKFKPRGEPVEHRPGDGYDSEASDRETDPIRESTFIIRTLPGPPMEYLKKALDEGTVGLSKQMGGADFSLQFLDAKSRRAVVTIDGIYYAAVLVQLPTITEATKTWDKKNMMKNSDISEMLLCFEKVKSEAEAKTVPIPEMVLKNEYKWPHGLTPPMHDVVHRRFRKTLSEKQWQNSTALVAKLLEEDAAALEVHVEVIHDDEFEDEDEEDAEGEVEQDYFGGQPETMEEDLEEDDEMLAAMEAALDEDKMQFEEPVVATPNIPLDVPEAPTPMTIDAITPAPAADEAISEEDEDEDDEEEEDEDEDDDEEEVDEEQLVAERERKEKLDEIEHLNKAYEDTLRQLTEVNAPILKRRILTTKANLEKEIAVKRAALGLTDDD